MISFPCSACHAPLEAENASSGLQLTCPQCRQVQTVPLPDFLPRTFCGNCQTDLMLTTDQAGLIVKCPKCGTANRAPDIAGAKGPGCSGAALVLVVVGAMLTSLPVFWWHGL